MTMYKKLKSVRKGTTWAGLIIEGVTINDEEPAATLSDVKMTFKKNKDDTTFAQQLTILNAGALISDSATWAITIPKRILTLDVGVWHWDMLTTDANGDKFTILEGTIEVIRSIT